MWNRNEMAKIQRKEFLRITGGENIGNISSTVIPRLTSVPAN